VVQGITLLTLLWTEGKALIPCDFRVYDKPQGGKTPNEHFQEMLRKARERGFRPEYVLIDSWYSSLKNLKLIASFGWFLLTRLKRNRLVNPDRRGIGRFGRWKSHRRGGWRIGRALGSSGYFGRFPQTGTRNTGRPMTGR
jgi:hypothetical protein